MYSTIPQFMKLYHDLIIMNASEYLFLTIAHHQIIYSHSSETLRKYFLIIFVAENILSTDAAAIGRIRAVH